MYFKSLNEINYSLNQLGPLPLANFAPNHLSPCLLLLPSKQARVLQHSDDYIDKNKTKKNSSAALVHRQLASLLLVRILNRLLQYSVDICIGTSTSAYGCQLCTYLLNKDYYYYCSLMIH